MTRRTLTAAMLAASVAATLAAPVFGQSKSAPNRPTSQWGKIDALLREKLGAVWQVARVETANDGRMRVVLKDRSISETQYQTMLLTACYHLTQPKAPKAPEEIAFVNVHERTGYVFEAPDRCGEFVKMPVSKVKIPILGVTRLF